MKLFGRWLVRGRHSPEGTGLRCSWGHCPVSQPFTRGLAECGPEFTLPPLQGAGARIRDPRGGRSTRACVWLPARLPISVFRAPKTERLFPGCRTPRPRAEATVAVSAKCEEPWKQTASSCIPLLVQRSRSRKMHGRLSSAGILLG